MSTISPAGGVARYHPVLVSLHWLIALLILGALGVGFFVLAAMPNSDPAKIDLLRVHMIVGFAILVLMLIRLPVRLASAHPARAGTGNEIADRLAPLTHWAFYLVVLAMIASGFGTSFLAGLPAIVFGHSGAPLPVSFADLPPFKAHSTLALILAALIALHVAAALYHHLVLKTACSGAWPTGGDDAYARRCAAIRPISANSAVTCAGPGLPPCV